MKSGESKGVHDQLSESSRKAESTFRPEALKTLGTIEITTPTNVAIGLPTKTTAMASLAILLGLVSFAALVQIPRRETATGQIIEQTTPILITANAAGRIKHVHAIGTSPVPSGAKLVTIDTSLESGAGQLGGRVQSALEERLNTLASEVTTKLALFKAQERQLEERKAGLEQQIRDNQVEESHLKVRRGTAIASVEEMQRLTSHGFVTSQQLRQKVDELTEVDLRLLGLTKSTNLLKSSIRELDTDLLIQRQKLKSEINSLRLQTSSAKQELILNESRTEAIISSPKFRSQIVSSHATVGQTVSPGSLLFTLRPDDAVINREAILINLYVSDRAAGFIKIGQDVNVRIEAYPHQRYGTLSGRVVSIGDIPEPVDDLPQREARAPGNAMSSQKAQNIFKIGVEIDQDSLKPHQISLKYKPGMTVSGDIVLDYEYVWQIVAGPLLAVRDNLTPKATESKLRESL